MIETWEPARWILPVDGLTITRTDAWWLRNQASGSLSAQSTGSCWANDFTFIATTWMNFLCDVVRTPLYGFYTHFTATTTGHYKNYDFGLDLHQVSVVDSASVQFTFGTPLWGTSHSVDNLGPWNIYEGMFLSTNVDGMAWEFGCDGNDCTQSAEDIFACGVQQDFAQFDYETCTCVPGASPIILDLDGDGLALTSWQNGVNFDLMVEGTARRVGWTEAGARDPFLVFDRNGNRRIDDGSELFGNFTEQPDPRRKRENKNGFLALAVFDTKAQGGNNDGVISRADSIFATLELWFDLNHDGKSQMEELFLLAEVGVKSIDLGYKTGKRQDEFGNLLRYRSRFTLADNFGGSKRRESARRMAYDVYFTYQQ